jgi:hypothetical protein
LETVENFESIPRRIAAVLKAKDVQHHINKEMCTVSVVFPLFCSTPVYVSWKYEAPTELTIKEVLGRTNRLISFVTTWIA